MTRHLSSISDNEVGACPYETDLCCPLATICFLGTKWLQSDFHFADIRSQSFTNDRLPGGRKNIVPAARHLRYPILR